MKIIDNFLPKETADLIEEKMLCNTFPWFYEDCVNTAKDNKRFFFTHAIIKERVCYSGFYESIAAPILNKLQPNKISRIKCNLYPRENEQYIKGFHIDLPEKHKVLLYSVNTNNGFTLFENGDKVPSIKNTALVFDGNLKHVGVPQTDEKIRMNININYL